MVPADVLGFYGHIFQHTTRLKHVELTRPRGFGEMLAVLPLLPGSVLKVIHYSILDGFSETMPWPTIDAALAAPQFSTLQRIELRDLTSGNGLMTPQARLLMPLANARGLLAVDYRTTLHALISDPNFLTVDNQVSLAL
ncbi:hypothetical protein C8R43DRAFT_1124036 [Mycena crocata]|nr:hypothetical protein C8R43DRAFT_1124036 [Mycena crocata]